MGGLILRNVVYGLLTVTLVLPACGGHICRCATSAVFVQKRATSAQTPAPLRPCCAKRLAAKPASPSKSGLKARCCCDEIRWSQSVAKIVSERGPATIFPAELAFGASATANRRQAVELCRSVELPVVRIGPGDSKLIVNCRWQV